MGHFSFASSEVLIEFEHSLGWDPFEHGVQSRVIKLSGLLRCILICGSQWSVQRK